MVAQKKKSSDTECEKMCRQSLHCAKFKFWRFPGKLENIEVSLNIVKDLKQLYISEVFIR